MHRIFITGICGFVGSNLAHYFQSLGCHVYGIDNLSRKGSEKNFKLLKKEGVKIFRGDLTKLKKYKMFKKNVNFHAFIHSAALTSVLDGTNNNSAQFLYKNNILSTLESLKLCSSMKSKFIYISSSRVYSISDIKQIKLKIKNNSFQLKKIYLLEFLQKELTRNFQLNHLYRCMVQVN